MRWLKRYSFLVMLLITAIGFGTGKLVKLMEQAAQEQATLEQAMSEQETSGQQSEQMASGQQSEQTASGQSGQQSEEEPDASESGEQMQEEKPSEAQGEASESGEQSEEQEKREFRHVELDYLDDALFIGDSRTATIYEYAGWEKVDFFVRTGLTIWDVWEKDMDGTYLEDILNQKQYGKIYIMLGVNELGNETAELFRQEYEGVLAKIRKLQPEAIIFVEAIIHVTAEKDAEGTYINNQEIDVRNQEIEKLTDGEKIFWLDANEVLDAPGTGKLNSEYTFDGVHLKVKYLDVWQRFLLEHGV